MSDWSLLSDSFYFSWYCSLKEIGLIYFLRFFDNPLSKCLIFKTISCMQWLFWVICKIMKGSRTGFWYIICACFFHKNTPYLILYQMRKFQCHIFFPSWDIKQIVLLSSYLDIVDVITSKIYLESSSKPMVDREKLWRSWKYKNLNILGTKRAF